MKSAMSVNFIKVIDLNTHDRQPNWITTTKLYSFYIDSDLTNWVRRQYRRLLLRPIQQVIKLYQWQTNVFHNDYDFDSHSIYGILEYKLKRIQHALLNGWAVHEPKDLKALALAIKLAGRIRADNYEEAFMVKHDLKWGTANYTFEPNFVSHREGATTPELLALERKEFSHAFMRAEARTVRDRKLFFAIVHLYERIWWD